ncbi:MAG TPA: hypothetical protein PLQ13_10395 [Candidatus Krumholzibacteria bacterium]|nr:hypothetical protein [Candidatus Krumholzibacteria bacterium]
MSAHAFQGREAVLTKLERIRQADKLGQPLLFVGAEGTGKEATALEFARRLNCADPAACTPAARCESCVKALTFQHPDIRWIGAAPATATDDEVRALFEAKIEDPFHQSAWAATANVGIGDPEHPGPLTVRSLIQFVRRRAYQSPWKVAIVADAQRMNAAAANAFLKTLEEPPPATAIMLLTTGTEGMLPTILSRCQKVRFEPWPADELALLLTAATGAPPAAALAAARSADGNGRRAAALLRPGARMVADWATELFQALHRGDRAAAALSADDLHRGMVPSSCVPEDMPAKQVEAKETAEKRERAILLCESLNLLYSDAVGCREAGSAWQPRLHAVADAVRAAAGRRRTATLLTDLAAIDDARGDIDRNLNIGLVMAVLFEGLIAHAERDQAAAAAG